jgi:hypothetical protein
MSFPVMYRTTSAGRNSLEVASGAVSGNYAVALAEDTNGLSFPVAVSTRSVDASPITHMTVVFACPSALQALHEVGFHGLALLSLKDELTCDLMTPFPVPSMALA